MFLVKVFCGSTVYKSEGGQRISAINSQVLAKLHLGSERADVREVVWCLRPLANCFVLPCSSNTFRKFEDNIYIDIFRTIKNMYICSSRNLLVSIVL